MKTENVVYIKQSRVLTDSHKLADFFLKDHRHVVRDIEAIMANLPVEFASSNLGVIEEESPNSPVPGATRKYYEMTYDAFMLVAMGYTGKKAMAIKLKYIAEFNRRGEELQKMGKPTVGLIELLEQTVVEMKSLKKDNLVLVEKVAETETKLETYNQTIKEQVANPVTLALANAVTARYIYGKYIHIKAEADKLKTKGKNFGKYTDSGRVTCVLNSFGVQKLWRKMKGNSFPYAVYNVAEVEAVEKQLGEEQ